MGIKITGTGSYAPERILTNAELEKMVETSNDWIISRTGIRERRIAAPNEACSDMACKAATNALAMAGVAPKEIDLIIVASVTPDKHFPSTAAILQSKLDASNATCFDLQAACTGFLYSLECANALMANESNYRKALIIGVEKLSVLTDWQDRNTCVLFGDGAGAVVLEKRTGKKDIGGILASKLGTDGKYCDILQVEAGGSSMPATHETIDKRQHFIRMEGQEVFKLAVNAMSKACRDVLESASIRPEDVRWLIPHQANLRIIKAVGTKLGMREENVFVNLDKYGNTSAASVVIALDEIVRSSKVERGDYLLLTAFGSGLTWGATLLRW